MRLTPEWLWAGVLTLRVSWEILAVCDEVVTNGFRREPSLCDRNTFSLFDIMLSTVQFIGG